MKMEQYIRNIDDFPKEGVQFKDITPLLGNAKATEDCLQRLINALKDKKIDKVVGIESRGFFFGILLAQRLNVGFVPIRKPGKLPYHTLKEPYELEYGMDALEIHEDAIKKGDNVLIHDDVLATGGTARAACNLVEKLGGNIVQCNFILEILALQGIKKIKNKNVFSLIKY